MATIKHMDAVYCPKLSTKPLLAFRKEEVNGVFVRYRNEDYWFTVDGVPPSRNLRSLPELFLATEDNKSLLSALYEREFEEDNHCNIYAVNRLESNGSTSKEWLYYFRGGYYGIDMSQYDYDIETFKEAGVHMSVLPEDLDKAVELNSDCKIISIAVDSIWNWANKVAEVQNND